MRRIGISRTVRPWVTLAVVLALSVGAGAPAVAGSTGGPEAMTAEALDAPEIDAQPAPSPGDEMSAQALMKVTPVDGAGGDFFGTSVATSGDITVIGAPGDDTAAGIDAGSAYVYVRHGTSWGFRAKLTASDAAANDAFGSSVAVYGDTILVGAHMDDALRGSAYVFTRSGESWTQQQKLVPATASGSDHVGISVALYQDTALLGTWAESAYVYVRDGAVWTQQAVLADPHGASGDFFGVSVGLYRDTALVGAQYDDGQRGSACVFARTGTAWGFQQKLTASDADPSDWFGGHVALYRDTAIVASVGDDDNGNLAGAAYVFERSGPTWAERVKLLPVDGVAGDNFGMSVSISGDTAVIGASGAGSNRGVVYLYTQAGGVWTNSGKLQPSDAAASDYYGSAADLCGGRFVVGAYGDDDLGGASGSAHLYLLEPFALPGITRVAGEDRYLTAIEASKNAFPLGASTVVLATGQNWPDALGGSALAGAVRGPILLTPGAALPEVVAEEIVRLGACRVYLLGGTAAVSAAVESALVTLMGRSDVVRLSGATRYETARAVADETIRFMGSRYDRKVFVATGADFPDATAASPVAAYFVAPVLLAQPASASVYRPPMALEAYILGGTSAISQETEDALVAEYGPTHVERLSGIDRYATAAAVAQFGVDGCMTWHGVGLASGTVFPDALSGGAMLGTHRSVLLLTAPATLSPATRAALETHVTDIAGTLHIIGGDAAISPAVEAEAALAAGL